MSQLKRDKNNVETYYRAWDQFDVDKELEKIDQEESKPQIKNTEPIQSKKNESNAKTKIQVIGGGRRPVNEIDNQLIKNQQEEEQIANLTTEIDKKTKETEQETQELLRLEKELPKSIEQTLNQQKQIEEEIKKVDLEKEIMMKKIEEMQQKLKKL